MSSELERLVLVQIEVTSRCNLGCPACARTGGRHSVGDMDPELFLGLLDQLPGRPLLLLHGLGEPLLHPRLFEMVGWAKERGFPVGWNDNGMLLDAAAARRIVAAEVDLIAYSVDSAEPERFARLRRGADLATVEESIRGLLAARRDSPGNRPDVAMSAMLFRDHLEEASSLVRFSSELGVDQVIFTPYDHQFSGGEAGYSGQSVRAEPILAAVFEELAQLARELGVGLQLPRVSAAPRGCDWPFRKLYVTWLGELTPCCKIHSPDVVKLGDLRNEPLARIWAAEPAAGFRERFAKGDVPEICRSCPWF